MNGRFSLAYPQITSRKKLSREWTLAAVCFFLTLLCTSFAGIFYSLGSSGFFQTFETFLRNPFIIRHGLVFSIPLVLILLAHELGHYWACKYYGMECTPPFFIPAPISITGTLGAFIRIKSAFIHRCALFDIAVAGPLAGFILTLPFLFLGIGLSKIIPKGAVVSHSLSFGEPLIFRFAGALILGYDSTKHDIIAHPIAMAAWVGLLATSLNLLPIWQLDGGHIAYAIGGRTRHRQLSVAAILFLVYLSLRDWHTPSYLLFAVLLLIVGWKARFYHPQTLFDEVPLGKNRLFLGLFAGVLLVLSFTPVPISFTGVP